MIALLLAALLVVTSVSQPFDGGQVGQSITSKSNPLLRNHSVFLGEGNLANSSQIAIHETPQWDNCENERNSGQKIRGAIAFQEPHREGTLSKFPDSTLATQVIAPFQEVLSDYV